jgi:large subunit ribosomal protein L4
VRNLPAVKLIFSGYLNVRDLLGYDAIVMATGAVEQVEAWLGADLAGNAGELVAAETEA